MLWQICALKHARGRYKQADFDLIHHVSFASIRYPTVLTGWASPQSSDRLEAAKQLRWGSARLSLRDWCVELLRDAHNRALRVDPITRLAFRDAKLIFLRTEESLVAVPRLIEAKSHWNRSRYC